MPEILTGPELAYELRAVAINYVFRGANLRQAGEPELADLLREGTRAMNQAADFIAPRASVEPQAQVSIVAVLPWFAGILASSREYLMSLPPEAQPAAYRALKAAEEHRD